MENNIKKIVFLIMFFKKDKVFVRLKGKMSYNDYLDEEINKYII